MSPEIPSEMLVTVTFETKPAGHGSPCGMPEEPAGKMSDLTKAGWNESLDSNPASWRKGVQKEGVNTSSVWRGEIWRNPRNEKRQENKNQDITKMLFWAREGILTTEPMIGRRKR